MSSSSNSPCRACKLLRRECTPECVLAPYFPRDNPQRFAIHVPIRRLYDGSQHLSDAEKEGIIYANTRKDIDKEKFSLRSSDNVVLEMKKSAAMSQSVVLGDHFRVRGFNEADEIPVQVSSLVLSKITSFCNKNHKFNSIIEGAVEQLMGAVNRLKGTVNDFMDWITGFVKPNKPLFSHLHQAADYLHIPALLELTSMAVGDMKESSVQEISDWYAGLSIPRMLSPLGIQAYSTLAQLDFFS